MAQQPPHHSPTSPSNANRRASWARAFHRVRAAMKRRNSSSAALATASPDARPSQELPATTDPIDMTAPTLEATEDSAIPDTSLIFSAGPSSTTTAIAAGDPIPVDDVQDDGPDDDSYPPVFFPQGPITDERGHDIFARYNLTYHPRGKQPQSEPPAKIRRVEKPVRLRVHWTCHECRTQFGIERVCANCGHRRCRSCERHPPKRVKNADGSRQRSGEQREAQEEEPTSENESIPETVDTPLAEDETTAVDPDLASYREEPAASPFSRNDTPPRESCSTPALPTTVDETSAVERLLEVDDDAEEDYEKLRSTPLTIYTRPRAAIQTVAQSSKRPVRRICHECTSPLSNNRNECLNCGHTKCTLCTPRIAPAATEEDEAPMFKGVKRVYRKPRQRVRYKCEHCNMLMESDRCAECGHRRCDSCHREPPRRQETPHNAELLAAVAQRFATYGGGSNIAGPSTAVPTI